MNQQQQQQHSKVLKTHLGFLMTEKFSDTMCFKKLKQKKKICQKNKNNESDLSEWLVMNETTEKYNEQV